MSLVIIIPLLTLFYRYFFDIDGVIDMPYKLYEWTLYIVMATCLVYGIVHLRFGIAAALIVAGTYPITGYTEAKYFGILGVFLLIALIGFIIRKVFFTKWTSYVKEEPVVETEEDTEK